MKNGNLVMIKDKDENQGVTRYIIKGRVNSKNSPVLLYAVEDALNNGENNIVLNMAQVESLSSDGIRIILKIYKKTEKAGGNFGIEEPSKNVRNILDITPLNEILIRK